MPKPKYEPIKLSRTTRYPGYQFYARVRVNGMDYFSAFEYLILTVFDWMLKRIPEEDRSAPELQVPPPELNKTVPPEVFQSYHVSIGYTLDITSLMYEGTWAMRLREPDVGTDERPAVPGRLFTTRVGLRLNEEGYTELGIKIDVTDPASVEKEVDFAFRPAFVRTLATQPEISFEHVRKLKFEKAEHINNEAEYKSLMDMLESDDNQMPLIVFTHVRPEEKKSIPTVSGSSIEDFIKKTEMDSTLRYSAFRSMEKPLDFTVSMPAGASGKKADLFIEPEKPMKPVKKGNTCKTQVSEPAFMPFNAEKFSGSAFAYARTYVLGDAFFDRVKSKLRKEFRPGDILLIGARKFGRDVTVIPYTGKTEEELKKAHYAALHAAQCYSKHKTPYSFGKAVFEADARITEQQRKTREIIESSKYEEQEKLGRLSEQITELINTINKKDDFIIELKQEMDESYNRGVAFARQESATLEEENTELKRQLGEKADQIDSMINLYKRAKNIQDTMEQMQKIDTMPVTNEDVVRYFSRVFKDRLGFTAQGAKTAAKCGISAANLWEILYNVANNLTDVFRDKQENLTEEDVMKATGFEMSFREGSKTRAQKDFMDLRQDVYDGETISIEPHIKLHAAKGIPAHQRLHFCYVQDQRIIVIGYLGDHLDSAASQYVK